MTARRWLSLLLCVFLAFSAGGVMAQVDAEQVTRVDPVVRDGKLYIDADVDFEVSSELRNAAQKGVPIYFTVDVEVVSKRWWWFDRVLVDEHQSWRVVYNALTRQWRVGTGELSLPEASFDDALAPIRNIRGWAVADVADLDAGEQYDGRIRVRLDTSRLPRPFQIDAYNSKAWSLATPWKDFSFSISKDTRDPS
ncbi:MAG TPA: DUF4390 domain-containing protein [Eoetvoesiella sp.]|jgi:hypothetical protein|uniref:DUF4390 domain-containing protein n=1 Tax=Eoetvoesiella sp. TaxID=1966355 RepID=UPI002BD653C1|nr:DUF4390 domain-containing protein [Eoetvoesiella sp.]HWK62664.1 DUF4390 domain-containing protein [Eoetvoesiella sp.]